MLDLERTKLHIAHMPFDITNPSLGRDATYDDSASRRQRQPVRNRFNLLKGEALNHGKDFALLSNFSRLEQERHGRKHYLFSGCDL